MEDAKNHAKNSMKKKPSQYTLLHYLEHELIPIGYLLNSEFFFSK